MLLTYIKRSDTRVAIELSDDEGTIIFQKMISRYKEADLKFLCKISGKSIAQTTKDINDVCSVLTAKGEYTDVSFECTPPKEFIDSILYVGEQKEVDNSQVFTVTVREIQQPKEFGLHFTDEEPQEALRKAFNSPENGLEPLVEWSKKDKLCCLDIDYHHVPLDQRPNYTELTKIVERVKPLPFCWHPSHAGGAKLYYVCKPGFTAEELASVAGISWVSTDNRATFDLIKSTRHPLYKRTIDNREAPCTTTDDIVYTYGSGDLSSVRKLLLAEVDPEDVQALLVEKGWTLGQTLPHSDCLINPTPDSKLNVFVGEQGVFCHRCQALGLGNRNNPGFTSYASMVGSADSNITTMVRNFCHVEHAKVILKSLFPAIGFPVLETVYRIMLKIVHTPDDPRIGLAMVAGAGFVRTNGTWVSADGLTVLTQNLTKYVSSLPTVLIPTEKGYSTNVSKCTALMNSGETTEYGYPPITFIRGTKIHGQFLKSRSEEITHAIVRKEFASCPPRYLTESKRMPSVDAWQLLEDEFPGIDRNYLRLLIAVKGAAEGRMCQCPFMLVTGPSGSGKTTTPHIAAGICGDKAEEPIWNPIPDRFRASLMDAARESSFVVVNEVFKSAKMARLDHLQALNPMLSLTEDSRSHVLYVGSVPFGRLPVFILTDVDAPKEVESDVQIARRFIYYRLNSRIEWEDSLITRGIRPHQFRLISQEHSLAADSILSEVIDEFFQSPRTLKDIASELSATSLENYSDEPNRLREFLREFYKAVIDAPLLEGSDKLRYSNTQGWKRIDRINNTRLNELWLEIHDGPEHENWQNSRAASSEDWQRLLGLPLPVVVDIRPYQNTCVYVRFRDAKNPKKPVWLNGKDVKN